MKMEFWAGLIELILINIVLSGDNAVVVALACRKLPAQQQKKAVLWGSIGAIVLRVLLTFAAVWLLHIPYVQLAGALMLLYIAVTLLKKDDGEDHVEAGNKLSDAIRTIVVADLVMSLDNVLAMAGAAQGNLLLIIIGLLITIPLIVVASNVLMRIMERYPVIVMIGSAVLGYTAGEMVLSDKGVGNRMEGLLPAADLVIPIALALLVVIAGWLMNKWQSRHGNARGMERKAG
ncbi:TerC family protein [Paenibacillus beijingensis]|uniref:Membrane protein n=1 Tax=Paenibacillus beijingensis TaxID=1126833 RepID=A0A0D5NF78_9BACL|nr:TerC family protein [Paenibacillus beijingensis]AJY73578.1 membrane protein [Paenibacillus beijingensis]